MERRRDWESWPPVSKELIDKVKEHMHSITAGYRTGMSGDEAIGILARVAGAGELSDKLESVYRNQQRRAEKQSLPSHKE